MRKPKEITNKIRQIQFEHLKKVYKQHLEKEPYNCVYNKKVVLHGSKDIQTRVCSYFSSPDQYEVCNTTECSKSCNAFIAKQTKKELRNLLANDIETAPKKYPEIMVLNWALEAPSKFSFEFGFFTKIKLIVLSWFRS